ncbi:MAG: FAD-linked oxidase C-terminal domain-containing protein [Pseudomonadota bacterium]
MDGFNHANAASRALQTGKQELAADPRSSGKTGEKPQPCPQPGGVEAAIACLKQRFTEQIATGEELRRQHANTLTLVENQPADAVFFAETTADVAQAVQTASDFKVPIIPYGAGTSLEGHLNAPSGGICIDLSRMDQVIAINAQDLDCTVQAGISRDKLNATLRDTGLFFPVDPGAGEASIGGMAATRASGTCAVRYGTMREAVLNATAVLADGTVIKTGGRARKSAAGYDLTRLLVGSEGTLGIMTELTVRLFGRPETILSAVAPFDTIEGACLATSEAMQLGLGLARIELLDPLQLKAVNAHSKLSLEEVPTLFVEVHGTPDAAREQITYFSQIAKDHGARTFDWAEDEQERNRLWKARHDAFWAVKSAWPGRQAIVTDVCVPISRLAEAVVATQADIEALGLIAPIVGHVGDGNFHCIVMIDPQDTKAAETLSRFSRALAERAIAMEGTCTGEHGIGQGKLKLLEHELGAGLDMMRTIKRALDPHNTLNPGKIFDLAGD